MSKLDDNFNTTDNNSNESDDTDDSDDNISTTNTLSSPILLRLYTLPEALT